MKDKVPTNCAPCVALSSTVGDQQERVVRLVILFCLVLTSTGAGAGEWGSMRSPTTSNRTIELTSLGSSFKLLWPTRVIPGDDMLLLESSGIIPSVTFYKRYVFVGVAGGALRLDASGSVQEKGQSTSKPDASFTKMSLIERSTDGSFYFTTSEIQSDGYFKISRASAISPFYTVELIQEKR